MDPSSVNTPYQEQAHSGVCLEGCIPLNAHISRFIQHQLSRGLPGKREHREHSTPSLLPLCVSVHAEGATRSATSTLHTSLCDKELACNATESLAGGGRV